MAKVKFVNPALGGLEGATFSQAHPHGTFSGTVHKGGVVEVDAADTAALAVLDVDPDWSRVATQPAPTPVDPADPVQPTTATEA
jgi:hypothetical protein